MNQSTTHVLNTSFLTKRLLEHVLDASKLRLNWQKTTDRAKSDQVIYDDYLAGKQLKNMSISSRDSQLEMYGLLIEVFMSELQTRKVVLVDLGIDVLAGDALHLDAIVSDGDEKSIYSLIQAEGVVNHLFMHSGFSLEVMIYEAFEGCKVNNSLLKSDSEHAEQTATH